MQLSEQEQEERLLRNMKYGTALAYLRRRGVEVYAANKRIREIAVQRKSESSRLRVTSPC